MMVESPQVVYVHDRHRIQDDPELFEVSLNTRGETPANGAREEIYEEVYRSGVDPAQLHKYEDTNIGKVWFNEDDTVSHIELDDWVVEEFLEG
jgi:hypothetical protein